MTNQDIRKKEGRKSDRLPNSVREYLAEIGRRGGKASRRSLAPTAARTMALVREARRAYQKFHAQCFWSYDPDLRITQSDIRWVGEQLKKHGNRQLWLLGEKFCR